MLKREKRRTHSNKLKEKLDKKIQETEAMVLYHRHEEKITKEKIELYDYINQQKDKDTKIGPLKINNEYIYDGKEICKILVDQYNSQYSSKSKIHKVNEEIFVNI